MSIIYFNVINSSYNFCLSSALLLMIDYNLSILFWLSISNIRSLSYLSYSHESSINEFDSNIIFFLHQIYQDFDYKFVKECCWIPFEYRPLNSLSLFSTLVLNFGALIHSILIDFLLFVFPFFIHKFSFLIPRVYVTIIMSALCWNKYIS